MHPLLFEISLGSLGILEVPAFGVLLSLAFGAGLGLTVRAAGRAGAPREVVLGACLVALFAGLFGARCGFVVLHPRELTSLGEMMSLRNGGLSGSFGLVVGVSALAFEARRRRMPWRCVCDFAAPALGLGVLLVRLGCWFDGCDFGRRLPASAPGWLARLGTFPAGSPAFVEQVLARELSPQAPHALPVHPSELYESAAGLLLLGVALVLGRRAPRAGVTALAVLVLYAATRVGTDFTRVSSPDVWCAHAVLGVALGVSSWLAFRSRRPSRPASARLR